MTSKTETIRIGTNDSLPSGVMVAVRPDRTIVFIPPGGEVPSNLPDDTILYMNSIMREGVERAVATRHVRAPRRPH